MAARRKRCAAPARPKTKADGATIAEKTLPLRGHFSKRHYQLLDVSRYGGKFRVLVADGPTSSGRWYFVVNKNFATYGAAKKFYCSLIDAHLAIRN